MNLKNIGLLVALFSVFTIYTAEQSNKRTFSEANIQGLDESEEKKEQEIPEKRQRTGVRCLTLISKDDKHFHVEYDIAIQSNFIKTMLKGDPEADELPLQISSDLLKPLLLAMQMIYYSQHDLTTKNLYRIIQNIFKNCNLPSLATAFKATIYLDFKPLENAFADKLAQFAENNLEELIALIHPPHWYLIEKFYYLRSYDLKPSIKNLLIYDNRTLQDSLDINPANFILKMERIIKQWELSINDLIDYNKQTIINHSHYSYGAYNHRIINRHSTYDGICIINLRGYFIKSLNGLERIYDAIQEQSGGYQVVELRLSDNQIKNLGDNITKLQRAMADLPILKLDLSNNQITDLKDSLNDLFNLEELNISNNDIIALENSLNNLLSLTELNISNNQITDLVQSLNTLEYNQLNSPNFDYESFELKKIYCDNNPLNQESLNLVEKINNPESESSDSE